MTCGHAGGNTTHRQERMDGMKYYKVSKLDGSRKEISKKEAKDLMDGSYRNIDSMLKVEQTIPLMFCHIEVTK